MANAFKNGRPIRVSRKPARFIDGSSDSAGSCDQLAVGLSEARIPAQEGLRGRGLKRPHGEDSGAVAVKSATAAAKPVKKRQRQVKDVPLDVVTATHDENYEWCVKQHEYVPQQAARGLGLLVFAVIEVGDASVYPDARDRPVGSWRRPDGKNARKSCDTETATE